MPDTRYLDGEDAGVWWWGRKQVTVTGYSPVSPDEYNGREYRQHTSTTIRPAEERVGVPVPAYLTRGLVEQARTMLSSNRAKERKYTAREWELRGMLRCGCGWSMGTHTARHGGKSWSYYYCNRRRQEGAKNTECKQKMLRAVEIERKVWGFVSGVLLEPERLVESVDARIERERAGERGDPDEQTASLMNRLQQIKDQRERAEDMAVAGDLPIGRLREKKADLDAQRVIVERELRSCSSRGETIRQLEDFRDRCRSRAGVWQRLMDEHPDLGEHVVGDMPWATDPFARAQSESLSDAAPEQRRDWYRRLQMEVRPVEGGLEVTGLFGERMLCDTKTLSTTN
ncbi:MAG: recombinase zinc beta ribbon domain-containing protein [Rubrobacter sp.]|nr:recombinase zinc beta ribbon domain-containing protein [Rubrobacter sp.]